MENKKEAVWWKKPLRVIQYNLQVKDTPKMDAVKIARDAKEMHANALVVNVGGIYAWYPTKVPFHHINEYLPEGRDLLKEIIDECHRNDIRLIARFDFSKTDDYVSQHHPEWFIRNTDGTRRAYGVERPGNWSILYSTCINAGFRNDDVAVPALKEVTRDYDIDGVFFNAPNYEFCTCEACRKKYRELYGKEMPLQQGTDKSEPTYGYTEPPKDLEPSFAGICYKDNIKKLNDAIKSVREDVPLILYYSIFQENLDDRLKTCDMLCVEAQDILSRGWERIPPLWMPQIIMKVGRSLPSYDLKPFGIIHSCPGMDWRHTGLPEAEYNAWLRQIPAAGGMIWHSITGFNDTVTDKRILEAVSSVNREISLIEGDMDGAQEYADAMLVWNADAAKHWANLLVRTQTQFSLIYSMHLTREVLAKAPALILPDCAELTEEKRALLIDYVAEGGTLIVESTRPEFLKPFAEVLGIGEKLFVSEYLTACYWQFEKDGDVLRGGYERTPILPHRGVTAYTEALEGTKVFATLIPPFAPLNSVGAPPERASMLVSHTDIPLCTCHDYGKGRAVMLPFHFAELSDDYQMESFFRLWINLLDALRGEKKCFRMDSIPGIVADVYESGDRLLVHLVNEIGQRPLVRCIPCVDLSFDLAIPEGKRVRSVESALEHAAISWAIEGGRLCIRMERLELWDMLRVTLEQA